MAYTRGNLAVKERVQEQQAQPQRYKETTKVVTRRTGLPTREKFLYLMSVIVCVIIVSVMVGRYVNIYDLNKQTHAVEQATVLANKEIAVLDVHKEKLENEIVAKARELGYVEPTSDREVIRVPRTTVRPTSSEQGSSDGK
ncbi:MULTISPECIES: hypothetical protein [unclassified Paenibacillus]|uniref:Cell division protein FtsL n=1 Tax=Paenibacillus provencensis TaxID=441151 RepID=A0ABW3PXZ4_9BACL|nr:MULTISPECIES: hypothetical protein [unclassified Paenibacillus]MCM3126254.1 hypothetical protein [Paenibacillus sp. MER 78]SFS61325.1 hypothetical protein SAMN04488601_1012608 [Paenibacillus sp. 453mf]